MEVVYYFCFEANSSESQQQKYDSEDVKSPFACIYE